MRKPKPVKTRLQLTTNRVVAIDPSAQCLYCAVRLPNNQKLLMCIPTKRQIVENFLRMVKGLGISHVVYESAYMSANPKTYAMLQHVLLTVQECTKDVGLAFCTVSPSEWQSFLLLKAGENSTIVKRDQFKVRSMQHAHNVMGYELPDSNYADAVCIFEYATRKEVTT